MAAVNATLGGSMLPEQVEIVSLCSFDTGEDDSCAIKVDGYYALWLHFPRGTLDRLHDQIGALLIDRHRRERAAAEAMRLLTLSEAEAIRASAAVTEGESA